MDIKAADFNRDAVLNSYYNDPTLANLKAIKNKKVAILANESILAKTYHIGRMVFTSWHKWYMKDKNISLYYKTIDFL